MFAIYKRELRSFFCSMIGYIFISCVLIFIGLYFMFYNLTSGYPYFSYAIYGTILVFIFTVPLLTMKSFAEERKTKTDQLLLTYPVSVPNIVFAKFLSMMTVVIIPLLISCVCPIIIALNGQSYLLVDYCTIFAYFILIGVFVSIGMFISSLTENQIIAAVITFGAVLVIYLWDTLIGYIPSTAIASLAGYLVVLAFLALILYSSSKNIILAVSVFGAGLVALIAVYMINSNLLAGSINNILAGFSCTAPLYNFAFYKVFDIGGLILYISFAALFVFLTVQSVEKRRWN